MVIIGGGVIGASVAFHLKQFGARDVVVLERAPRLGGGSTSKATGGFRTQFGTEINIRLSLLSRNKLMRFEEEIGAASGYRSCGYLFLARDERTMQRLRDANTLQQKCGIREARVVDASEARKLNPAVEDDTIVGGTFCPTDGFVRPMALLRGYAQAALLRGARFEFGVECSGFRTRGGRIDSVVTSRGEIGAGVFVNAAGPWAGRVSDVPVTPLRRQVAITEHTTRLPETMPMTIWADDGFHFRVRDERVMLLWPDGGSEGFDTEVDPRWVNEVERIAHERVPVLRSVPIARDDCYAGLYEMSPDRHAILGRDPQIENLFLAAGSSGHGVMHSPAIGQLVAEMIRGRRLALDVSPLRPTRFAEGAAIESPEFL